MAGRRVGILAALVWTNRQESLADSRTTMKRSIPWLMCAALAACGGGDGGDRPQPQRGDPGAAYTVQLAGGVPQVLAPESLTLTLAKVDDTRCPAQAQCVWRGDEGKRRAFELTRQAIGYRMLQLLALPLETMDRTALQAALAEIGRS